MNLYTKTTPFNADTYTPVQLYLSIRNNYRKTCLLESNDYHSRSESKSFIGFNPILELLQFDQTLTIKTEKGTSKQKLQNNISNASQIQEILSEYVFESEKFNGFFGRVSFEYNLKDETHISKSNPGLNIPDLHLFIFKYIIVIDHFTNEGFIIENSFNPTFSEVNIQSFCKSNSIIDLPFELLGKERALKTDDEFLLDVEKGIHHCKQGDVFQLVLSNRFEQDFFGDDFQVYRQLRQLNPSPYLFYFEFEDYRLFGSSPEAQLIIKNKQAEIHPIAGTIPKTGIQFTDETQLEFLLNDEKENAEHTMLVDLARNDLSRDCSNVKVTSYKEVQHFSHVTHLVSKVTGKLKQSKNFEVFCHSLPAGTLSGTPKSKAMELIHQFETRSRDFYGGSIGIFTPSGDINTAIVIRSVLSKNNTLYYQAGAGVVLDSIPEREVLEIHHKLRAIRFAINKTVQTKPITSC